MKRIVESFEEFSQRLMVAESETSNWRVNTFKKLDDRDLSKKYFGEPWSESLYSQIINDISNWIVYGYKGTYLDLKWVEEEEYNAFVRSGKTEDEGWGGKEDLKEFVEYLKQPLRSMTQNIKEFLDNSDGIVKIQLEIDKDQKGVLNKMMKYISEKKYDSLYEFLHSKSTKSYQHLWFVSDSLMPRGFVSDEYVIFTFEVNVSDLNFVDTLYKNIELGEDYGMGNEVSIFDGTPLKLISIYKDGEVTLVD